MTFHLNKRALRAGSFTAPDLITVSKLQKGSAAYLITGACFGSRGTSDRNKLVNARIQASERS